MKLAGWQRWSGTLSRLMSGMLLFSVATFTFTSSSLDARARSGNGLAVAADAPALDVRLVRNAQSFIKTCLSGR